MKKKKKRIIQSVIAVMLMLAIILTGTYAWQSISQKALNETIRDPNPGGRLHDDFNGENKDVYVENFSETEPIFARIRLDEYMEIGTDAGINRDATDRDAVPVIDGADINDSSTWATYIPEEYLSSGNHNEIHDYWTWETGGSTVFMPTFNKNKDSLKSDVNGTFEGPDGNPTTDGDRYKDYKIYTNGQEMTAEAVYDADMNDVDEGEAAVEDVNITTKEETHTAKETQNATVLTMKEWIESGAKQGKFWIYDEDGWAYWGEAIQPGEATGLLLDGIELTGETKGRCYYAINVVAQFATVGDWGDKEAKTGFYQDNMTDNALLLLNNLVGYTWNVGDEITIDGIDFYVLANDTTNNRILIWSKDVLFTQAFGSTNVWESSTLRTYLNETWLSENSTLQRAVETTITTRSSYNSNDFIETKDKVFLLSEADLFGTTQGGKTAVEQDYTYNGAQLPITESMRKCSDKINVLYNLRSPAFTSTRLTLMGCSTGTYVPGTTGDAGCTYPRGVRPALWIKVGPESGD